MKGKRENEMLRRDHIKQINFTFELQISVCNLFLIQIVITQQVQELTGSDQEFLIPKFTLELKKVGKITRPYRFDLNQIPYNYTVEVTNRFKGLDLIDRVPEDLWTEVCGIVQEVVIKTIHKKKKCKKAKWLSDKALQIAEKRSERQRRKGKTYPFEFRAPKNSKER